ncbi:hypothetical protein F5Y03DRAFT_389944 [Xylaria venustula]|nr:hypothetical protein F5Y03DRAFT_389944 [Xylaria venustula]
MGEGDLDTIIYANVRANNIPSGHEQEIKELEEMLDLTHRWLDIHAGIQTKIQKDKGALPSDNSDPSRFRHSDYRIKVLDTIMSNGSCAWLRQSSGDNISNNISVKKAEFHAKIIKDILAGVTTVRGISNALEQALNGFSRIVVEHAANRASWNLFNVFTQGDYRLTKSVWDYAKPEVENFIKEIATDEIRDPIDGEIEP